MRTEAASTLSAAALPQRDAGAIARRRSAEELESVFLAQVLEHLTAGLEVDAVFGGGPAEGIFRSQMHEQYAKAMIARGGIGLAAAIEREILKLQEAPRS